MTQGSVSNAGAHFKSQLAPFPCISFTQKTSDHQEKAHPSHKKAKKPKFQSSTHETRRLTECQGEADGKLSEYRDN